MPLMMIAVQDFLPGQPLILCVYVGLWVATTWFRTVKTVSLGKWRIDRLCLALHLKPSQKYVYRA